MIDASEPRRYRDHPDVMPSIPRIGALAAALLLHAGLLMSLLAPDADRAHHPSRAVATSADVLRVRLLPSWGVAATHPRPPPSVTRRTHRASAGSPVAPVPDYVRGSGRFAAPAYGASNMRVPGHDGPVRGASTIAMADPRTQGVAGAVRFVGSLLGAVDPHCVDVDAWRGMTARERIAHHVDPDAIEATASHYGCAPPPVRPGSPVYWRDRR